MLAYDWIVFDADETLFRFDAFRGLQQMFASYGVDFSRGHHRAYQTVNKRLWAAYQNNEITAQQVKRRRFAAWGESLQVDPEVLNSQFLQHMVTVSKPLEGAPELVRALHGRAKLGIITNGFRYLQDARLAYNGMASYFEWVVVSEELGTAKPNPPIFAHALERMGHPAPERVLMVGDTPATDILGGNLAGMRTCWLNLYKKPATLGIEATYEVPSLAALQALLLPEGGKSQHETARHEAAIP